MEGYIAFQCFVPLSSIIAFGGGHIALRCFVRISDKGASAILQLSSTILTVTHMSWHFAQCKTSPWAQTQRQRLPSGSPASVQYQREHRDNYRDERWTKHHQMLQKYCITALRKHRKPLGKALIHGASSSKRWATPSIQWEALKRKWTCSVADSTPLGHRESKTFTGLVVGLADTLCQDRFCRYHQDELLGVKPLSSLKTLKIS